MKIGRRVDIETNDILDVRHLEDLLKGKYDNLYITFTTIEEEADAWEDQGDSFLHIPLPRHSILDREDIDYKEKIISHLPLLEWLDLAQLRKYVEEKMQN